MIRLNRNGDYWQARWNDPITGRVMRRGIGCRSKVSRVQALAVCKLIANEVAATTVAALDKADDTTLEQYRNSWFAQRTDLMRSSVITHERYWRMLTDHIGAATAMRAVTKDVAASLRRSLEESANIRCGAGTIARARAEHTIARCIRNARLYWRDAMQAQIVTENPWMSLRSTAPEVQIPRRLMTAQQADALIRASKTEQFGALIALCFYAGLRRHEALSLEWASIDWAKRRLTVWPPNGRVTTKHRHREVRMEAELQDRLAAVKRVGNRVCAGVTEGRAWQDLQRAAQVAGLDFVATFQQMRQSRENIWMGDGFPPNVVTAWLGHSATVAAKHYRGVPERYYDSYSKDQEIARLKLELQMLRQSALAKESKKTSA